MVSINEATVGGYVGSDPEIRDLPNGGKVANFSIATTRRYKNRDGEQVEKTIWHQITVFGGAVEGIVAPYVRKGSALYVKGSMETTKWRKEGESSDRYSTSIVVSGYNSMIQLLDRKNQSNGPSQPPVEAIAETVEGMASDPGDENWG